MLTLLWSKKKILEIKLLSGDKAIKKTQIYSIMIKLKLGGEAGGQKAENLEMKRSSASLIADTRPMLKKMALLTIGHLLLRILLNTLRH